MKYNLKPKEVQTQIQGSIKEEKKITKTGSIIVKEE